MKVMHPARRMRTLVAAALLFPLMACGSSQQDADAGPLARAKLVVSSPDNAAVLHTTSAELRFHVEDAPATGFSVTLGDAAPAVVEQSIAIGDEVTHTLTLAIGVNEVRVALLDGAGEADDATLVLVVEPLTVVRPELALLAPDNGLVVHEASVDIAFEVEKTAALGYAITVGDAAPVEVAQAIAVGDTITTTVALVEGVNTIVVRVLDAEGVADSATRVVVVDLVPAPTVVIDTPSASLVFDDAHTVTGRVLTDHAATARFSVNDGAPTPLALVAITEGYAFSFEAPLTTGENTITVTASNDLDEEGSASVRITRDVDDAAPTISLAFPRNAHAVRTRRVLVRGNVTDADVIDEVWLEIGNAHVPAELDEDGSFRAWLDLEPASNAYSIHATDRSGNVARLDRAVYFGQQLGAGGAFGGAIRGGEIFTWGRNNLGQTGLDYVSHETRANWCDRALVPQSFEATICKATTLTLINALCDASWGAGTAEAATCKATTATERTNVCLAAGAGAPTNCATSATANLMTACDVAYGVGTPTNVACKVKLVCEATYAAGSPERATCTSFVTNIPTVFPAPGTPYSATRITRYSTIATPAAATGSGVTFASLGVTFTSLAFNQNAASALDSAGYVWGWGDGANGMLCLGDAITDADANDRKIPHRVAEFGASGTRAIALSRGYDHLLVLRSDGSVWGCGQNTLGQLGDGTSGAANNRAVPTQVVGLPANVIQVLASSASSYALTSDGRVYAWGRNEYANLGQGMVSSPTTAQVTPLLVPGLTDVTMIASGRDHVLAARADGSVWAWGLNASHQVGPGASPVTSPVAVAAVSNAFAVYANGNQGFYEDAAGRLWGWGQNGNGNLGIPEDADQETPNAPVFGINEAIDVGIGALHGFAMRGNVVFAWGWSFHGSLGAGSSTIHSWSYRTPILVQLLP